MAKDAIQRAGAREDQTTSALAIVEISLGWLSVMVIFTLKLGNLVGKCLPFLIKLFVKLTFCRSVA